MDLSVVGGQSARWSMKVESCLLFVLSPWSLVLWENIPVSRSVVFSNDREPGTNLRGICNASVTQFSRSASLCRGFVSR
jgi:hypothetical protein